MRVWGDNVGLISSIEYAHKANYTLPYPTLPFPSLDLVKPHNKPFVFSPEQVLRIRFLCR